MDEKERFGQIPAFGPPAMPAGPPDPGAARARRFRRRVVTVTCVVAAAAGVGLGATALAGAASSPSTTAPPSPSTPAVPRPAMGGRLRFGGPGLFGPGLGGGVVHGQYTIKGPKGYETIDERSGTVSSVRNTSGSTWSLTVKSADGTSGTFVVDPSTSVDGGESGIGSVKTGDSVTVVGTGSGSTVTATRIMDQTVLEANGKTWLPTPARPVTPDASGRPFFGAAPGTP